jgi:hypothetical protein
MINSRLFGADIPLHIKRKLEARQTLAEKPMKPYETITSKYVDEDNPNNKDYKVIDYITNTFDGEADLASRTPFVRMWTAVQVVQAPDVIEDFVILYEGESLEDVNIVDVTEAESLGKDSKAKWKEEEAAAKVVQSQNPNSSMFWDGTTKQWKVRRNLTASDKAQGLSDRRIYTIGNNVLNTISSIKPNQSVKPEENASDEEHRQYQSDVLTNELLPPEHGVQGDHNKFMKPPAGITSLESETEGTMGMIKKTSINFIVHNFADYDKIYNKFFLRPGAQIFVDFGWNTADLYDQEKLIDSSQIETDLYGEIGIDPKAKEDGYVTRAKGDIETIIGIVTGYNSKITANGAVECSVELTSKNIALMGMPTNEILPKKIEYWLDNVVQFEALYNLGDEKDQEALSKVPDFSTSTENMTNFEVNMNQLAINSLGGVSLNPTYASILSGCFLSRDGDDTVTYVSWGLIEDKILNAEFGHGDGLDAITSSDKEDFEISIDSSNEFTSYHEDYEFKQNVMGNVGETFPDILVPHFWDRTYNTMNGKSPNRLAGLESPGQALGALAAATVKAKTFEKDFDAFFEKMRKISSGKEIARQRQRLKYDGIKPATDADKEKGAPRIPIREIFVKTDVVKEAFSTNNTSARKVINAMLETINKASYDIFKWKIGSDGDDKRIKIFDENMTAIHSTEQVPVDRYDSLFKFNVMSPNSIVKSYDVSLDMPDGAVGSMYAIQGAAGSGGQMTALNQLFGDSAQLQALFQGKEDPKEKMNKYITYLPDISSFAGNKLAYTSAVGNQFRSMYKDFVDVAKKSKSTNKVHGHAISSEGYDPFEDPEPDEEMGETTADLNEETMEKTQKAIRDREIAKGTQFASSFDEYFKHLIGVPFQAEGRSVPLPMTLSLAVYGISSISPGCIFMVDYLPKLYLQNVYFQVMKVKQTLGADGWFTEFETQFRIKPDKEAVGKPILRPNRNVKLETDLLDELEIDDSKAYRYKKEDKGKTTYTHSAIHYNRVPYWNDGWTNFESTTRDGFKVIRNFEHLKSMLYDIQPVEAEQFNYISFLCKAKINIDENIKYVVTLPLYFYDYYGNNAYNGYGAPEYVYGRKFHAGIPRGGYNPHCVQGYDSNYNEIYLFTNKTYPTRHWGISPAKEYGYSVGSGNKKHGPSWNGIPGESEWANTYDRSTASPLHYSNDWRDEYANYLSRT